jgi:hypothetical protein
MKSHRIILLAFIHALLLALPALVSGAETSKPNILLILADDMGWGDLRCNGNDLLDTPSLDKLQAESVALQHFFVSPVCSPTRSSLLTGRHHFRLRVLNTTAGLEVMHGDEMTLAEALKPAGYINGCFGKWHNGANHPSTARGQGFDEFFGFNGGFFSNYFDPELEHDGVTAVRKGFITDVLADAAISFIEKHRSQPFFCSVPFNACHSPMQAPEDLFTKYSAKGFEPKTAAVYAMIENLDTNNGRMLAKLDALEKNNIAARQPEIAARLSRAYDDWFHQAVATTDGKIQRFPITLDGEIELLAPYAALQGGAEFFGKGWDNDWVLFPTDTAAALWNLDVPSTGHYEVTVMHTANKPAGKIQAAIGESQVEATITAVYDPPEIPRPDRFPRWEVPDKAFAPLRLGIIEIRSGKKSLQLTATPGVEIQSVRLQRMHRPSLTEIHYD